MNKEYVPKEVIGEQLLVALDDKSKCTIVLNEDDLEFLIMALKMVPIGWRVNQKSQMIKDLTLLQKSVYGKKG